MQKFILILFLSALPAMLAFAQDPSSFMRQQTLPKAPANAPTAQVAQPQPAPQAQTGFFESATAERFADKIFDVKSDSIDPNGNIKWKGKTFSVGDSPLVRARFERYLAMPASSKLKEYEAILAEITAQLAANNDNISQENIKYAWNRLFDAAEYDIDGNSSLVIANLVYLSWRMRTAYNSAVVKEGEKERDVRAARNLAKEKAEFLEYAADKVARQSSKKGQLTKGTATMGSADLAYRLQDLQKQVAELATAKVNRETTAFKAIAQYQSQLVSFLMERKFQQAQISAMFYRHIYAGNAQDLRVGKEQIETMIPISSFLPTIDALEMISIEARKDIFDGMQAVESLYSLGNKYAALERLMETFVLGENDVVLAVFPFEKRAELLKIYKNLSLIKKLCDAYDWGTAKTVVEETAEIAKDFPSVEILSKLNTAMRASNMALVAAKQAAAIGSIDDVKKNLELAAKYWPLNPDITTFNDELLGLTKGISQYVKKFDEHFERGNFRDIVEEAPEYGIALKNDAMRAKKLREIVVKISQIDSLIAQAAEFERQKNPYFAWDILENAVRIDSSDPVLARAIARLAPEVSDYVKALNRAKTAEENKEYAMALNYYLAAKQIFPASQACRLGIERVASKY